MLKPPCRCTSKLFQSKPGPSDTQKLIPFSFVLNGIWHSQSPAFVFGCRTDAKQSRLVSVPSLAVPLLLPGQGLGIPCGVCNPPANGLVALWLALSRLFPVFVWLGLLVFCCVCCWGLASCVLPAMYLLLNPNPFLVARKTNSPGATPTLP